MSTLPASSSYRPALRGGRPNGGPLIGGDMPFARIGLAINAMVPLGLLIWDAFHNQLGVNSVNFAIHTTGLTGLVFLVLSLCVTPLRSVSGFSWLIQFRRSLGLFGFFYVCCHLAIFFWWDRARSVSSTFYEITRRPYLIIGSLALLLLAPLAATSTNYMIRKLGGKKWKALHRLAYLAVALGCIHYYMQVKADTRQPKAFIAVLSIALAYRMIHFLSHRRSTPMVMAKGIEPAATGKARFWNGKLRIARISRETSNVSTFRLVSENSGPIPFNFMAGQFLNVSFQIDGKKANRSYTIASPPTRSGYVELTIKREEQGLVSRHLHEKFEVGQTIDISAPAGRFTFFGTEADSLLLIAGGVGVTPVMSILRDLTDRSWGGPIDFVFSVKTPNDVIYAEEFKQLAAHHPNVRIHLTITREKPQDWTGLCGRITADLLRSIVPDLQTRLSFICGPDEMAAAVRSELLLAGVTESRIRVESFTPASAVAPKSEIAATSLATVTFAKSNQSAALPGNRSILEAAESVGVPIDFDCRSGICGRCRAKLLSGAVMMSVQDALSDADIADGYILACQAHATADVSIDA